MKTLRQLSDDEQIEAIAADPHAEINLRIWAKEMVRIEQDHERFMARMNRGEKIVTWAIWLIGALAVLCLVKFK